MRRSTTDPRAPCSALLLAACAALVAGCGDDAEPSVTEERADEVDPGPPPPAEETSPAPAAEVPAPRPQLALGAAHACALSEDGSVRCWGSQRFGQLGPEGPTPGPEVSSASPVAVPRLGTVVRLAAGSFHTCALSAEGEVRCWGHGGFGQLGVEGDDDRQSPVRVPLGGPAIGVAAGEGHSCALLASRRVACWGRNTFGQLGDASATRRPAPRPVEGVGGVASLALGRDHSCALLEDGEVRCWGAGFEGQLGDGERTERRATPAVVRGLPAAGGLVSGSGHLCAIVGEGGAVRCWGRNDSGQVGDGRGGDPEDVTPSPVAVPGLDEVVELAAGARFSCARRRDGTVRCWGYNGFGQIGDGTEEELRPAPTPVAGLSGASELAAGARFACARLESGGLRCWGRNHLGQLGVEAGDPHFAPTACCGTGQQP